MTGSTVTLDSWAWIGYLQSDPRAARVKEIIDSDNLVIASAINVAEVSVFLLRHGKGNFAKLVQERARVVPVDEEIAQEAAALKVKHKLGLADAIVFATAQKHGAPLVTGDPDFKGMENVIYLGS